jgi:hypothetical protein
VLRRSGHHPRYLQLVKQAESLVTPPEDFNTIASSTAEDKDLPAEGILIDLILNMGR